MQSYFVQSLVQSYTHCTKTDKVWHNFRYTQKNYQWDKAFVLGAGNSEVRWSLQLIGLKLPDGQGSGITWLAWIHYHWELLQAGKNRVWPAKRNWTVASIFSSLVGQSPYLHSWDNKTLRKSPQKVLHMGTSAAILLTFTPWKDCQWGREGHSQGLSSRASDPDRFINQVKLKDIFSAGFFNDHT